MEFGCCGIAFGGGRCMIEEFGCCGLAFGGGRYVIGEFGGGICD